MPDSPIAADDLSPGKGQVSIGRQIAKGAAWMVMMRLSIRGIGLVSTVILARLLVPEDFGLVAMAALLVAFLEAASEMSFDVVLIQKQDATRAHYDTVWTMQLLRGVTSAVALVGLAEPGALFFGDPRLANILYWLALGALIGGATNVGIVDFRKHMEFHKDFVFFVLVKLVSFIATIAAAIMLRSYWALIIGMLANEAARFALSYIMSRFRPRLTLRHWREIFAFSKWLLFNNILQYLRTRADSLIVGKLLGPATLGFYTIALEISSLAASELVAPFMRAVFPGFSKLAHDDGALRHAFIQASAIIQTICLPVVAGIGLTAHLTVPLLLGPKWINAIPLIQVLTIYNLFYVAGTNLPPILVAKGRPDLLGKLAILANAVALPAMAAGTVMWGAVGTAAGLSVATFVVVVINLSVVMRLVGLGWLDWIRLQWRPWAAVVVMMIAVLAYIAFNPAPPGVIARIGNLVTIMVIGAVTYVTVQLIFWRVSGCPTGAESYLLEIANRVWEQHIRGRIVREGTKSR